MQFYKLIIEYIMETQNFTEKAERERERRTFINLH